MVVVVQEIVRIVVVIVLVRGVVIYRLTVLPRISVSMERHRDSVPQGGTKATSKSAGRTRRENEGKRAADVSLEHDL